MQTVSITFDDTPTNRATHVLLQQSLVYIVHSSTLYCMVSVCVTTIDRFMMVLLFVTAQQHRLSMAAVCNSAISFNIPPSFLLLAILQGDVDRSLTAGQEVSSVLAK